MCRRPSARHRDRPCAIRRGVMAKFTIQPHGRLQEWIAHEKGYFRDAGLDYEFRGGLSAQRKKEVDASGEIVDVFSGAFESYQQGKGNKGVKSDISCACHWAVNQASSQQIGRMWGKSYVVTPGGVMVPRTRRSAHRRNWPGETWRSATIPAAISP